MGTEEIILNLNDFEDFRSWIKLDLDGLTWQGRFQKEFEEFWEVFFLDGLSARQVFDRLTFACKLSKIGPLVSWFSWLRNKFICYCFIYRGINLYNISKMSNLPVNVVANILYDFFVERFPHIESELSTKFQVGDVSSKNLFINFVTLNKELGIPEGSAIEGNSADDVMSSLEVTLYGEWNRFLKKIKKDLLNPNFDLKKIKEVSSLSKQLIFFRDLFALLIIGALLILAIKEGNQWYEEKLSQQISIYEPQFLKVDKSIKFREKDSFVSKEGIKENLDELDRKPEVDLEELVELAPEEERFETESEVVLTSWDTLPKDFQSAELEQSEYEEQKKGGFRDTRFGNKKVYRVMMKSVDPHNSRGKLNDLIRKYSVVQGDNVKPGTFVPGGVYYNLFVPRNFLVEFIAQVMDVDESILYESRTRGRNPPGKNRVFIWIKNI